MKVGIVQHSFSEDVDSNRARNLTAIENLAADGARVVVLSELHDSLYFCQTEDVENFRYAESDAILRSAETVDQQTGIEQCSGVCAGR